MRSVVSACSRWPCAARLFGLGMLAHVLEDEESSVDHNPTSSFGIDPSVDDRTSSVSNPVFCQAVSGPD